MSEFSAILFLRSFLLTNVLRIAHVTIPLANIRIVEPSTIHPPHAKWGTNSNMSTKKARSVISSVGMESMRIAMRYRGE